MKPTKRQTFTIGPGRKRTEEQSSAQAGSWWMQFATGPRDEQFDIAAKVRFAVRKPYGPILKDWTTP